MKRAIVGLIMLGLVGVAHAVELELTNNGDNQWSTTNNWVLRGTTTPHGSLPTASDRVWVTGAMEIDGAGSADNVSMNQAAVFTIASNATLNARALLGGKTADIYNYGTVTLSLGVTMGSTGCEMFNYGDITASGDLSFNKGGDFHMLGGTFNGNEILTGNKAGASVLNLHGGTMTFDDINLFDTDGTFYGSYTMDVANDGKLIIEGQNMVTYFRDAISSNLLTGVTASDVSYDGDHTYVHIRKGTVVSIK